MDKCPRCGHELREVEPGPIWLRHWLRDQCDRSYIWQLGQLTVGRKKREGFAS